MTTELLKQDIKFDVEVNTTIHMKNEETLDKLVTEVESKYRGIVYTEDTIAEAKKDKASLNKIVKSIEDERKRVKKGYNEPLDNFEKKMKVYVNRISGVIKPIDDDVKAFAETQKIARKEEVQKLINENAKNFNLETDAVVIQDGWLIESLSGVKRTKLVTDEMKRLQLEKEHLENEIKIITAYCSALKLDNGGWLAQIKQGVSSPEVIKSIDEFNQQEKERIENERLIELEQQIAAERKIKEQLEVERIESERIELEKVSSVNEVNKPTASRESDSGGVDKEPHTMPQVAPKETLILKITGTSEQLDKLSDYVLELGVEVETV